VLNKIAQFTFLLVLCSGILGCGEHAARQAGQGAAMGAASGAVGGMVSAIIFGGDPVEAAARGAVYGGAVSATAGAISGSQVDASIREQRQAREDQIREEIGSDAFKGLSALVSCDYEDTISYVTASKASSNPNYVVAGYWLELLSYADKGDLREVERLLPIVIKEDWDTNNKDQASTSLRQLQTNLEGLRVDYKLDENCAG
jgi:hypothetical protein